MAYISKIIPIIESPMIFMRLNVILGCKSQIFIEIWANPLKYAFLTLKNPRKLVEGVSSLLNNAFSVHFNTKMSLLLLLNMKFRLK